MKHIEDYVNEDYQIDEGIIDFLAKLFSKIFNIKEEIPSDKWNKESTEHWDKFKEELVADKKDEKSIDEIKKLYSHVQKLAPESIDNANKTFDKLDIYSHLADITRILTNLQSKSTKAVNELKSKKMTDVNSPNDFYKLLIFISSALQMQDSGISNSALSSLISTIGVVTKK